MPRLIQLNDVPIPKNPIIISIDPGRNNFACRIEKRWDNGKIEPFLLKRIDFGYLILQESTKFLMEHDDLIKNVNILVMERQMPINYSMVRLSQHIESYFLSKYPQVAVFEINPKVKPEKPICFEAAMEELEKGGDTFTINFLVDMKSKKEKCDDLCDTIGQIKGFYQLLNQSKTGNKKDEIPLGPELGVSAKKKKSKISKAPTQQNKEFLSVLIEKSDNQVIDIREPSKTTKKKSKQNKTGKVLPKNTSTQLHSFLD